MSGGHSFLGRLIKVSKLDSVMLRELPEPDGEHTFFLIGFISDILWS